jgi:hypothetical protein
LPSIENWDPGERMGRLMKKCYRYIHLKGEKPKPKGVKVEVIGPTAESCT